jgi:hypothetical protein
MQEKEEGIREGEEEFGVLCSGRRYKKLRMVTGEIDHYSEYLEHHTKIHII